MEKVNLQHLRSWSCVLYRRNEFIWLFIIYTYNIWKRSSIL